MDNELIALFSSGFISATLFPGGSELLLAYLVQLSSSKVALYIGVATLGNVLGAFITYLMGYYLYWGREKAQQKHHKVWRYCQRYGSLSLLFSWLPIIGDLLPLVAGWLRLPVYPSALFITLGKAARYCFIAYASLYLL